MKRIQLKEDNPNGLYQKYVIRKVIGINTDAFGNRTSLKTKRVEENSEYFVLRLDLNGGDINHLKACRKAIHTYAELIRPFIPKLADDLVNRYPLID